jgi:uncharacterized lipoprotein YddW (UPF0748 family)
MTSAGGIPRAARHLAAAAMAGFVCLVPTRAPAAAQDSPAAPAVSRATEVRALWVLRTSLTTPGSVNTLVQSAREHGFNTLLVQVRGRGDAYFRGGIEPVAPDLLRQSDRFDPLAAVLAAARPAGLRVHAWVNVNLVSSAAELPTARDHVIHRRPAWLMVPRDIAQELSDIEPDSPAYVGKLARWTRLRAEEIEGLYTTPILPAAAAHTEAVARDLARRYDVDGVHLDYARYPSDRFDYSRAAIAEFRTHVRPRLAEAARRELDAQESDDVLAYPDALPDEWRDFRIARMTSLVRRLRDAVKEVRPGAIVTAATAPDAREAAERRLQDWKHWLDAGLIDAVCPMAYAPEPAAFAEQISAAREAAGAGAVWAGIGAYRLSAAQTVENIQTARRLGAAGVVLFSYDSLTNPRQASRDYLAVVGRGAFADRATPDGSR